MLLKNVVFIDGKIPKNQTKLELKFHSFESLQSNDGKIAKSILRAVSPEDPAMIMFTSVSVTLIFYLS